MQIWQKLLIKNKSISWLLITVVLAIVLLPTHMHLQHVEQIPATSHEHAIDFHVVYDQHDHDHSEVAVMDGASDFLIKQLGDNPLAVFILFSLILILANVCQLIRYSQTSVIRIREYHYHLSPPLRAPPQ